MSRSEISANSSAIACCRFNLLIRWLVSSKRFFFCFQFLSLSEFERTQLSRLLHRGGKSLFTLSLKFRFPYLRQFFAFSSIFFSFLAVRYGNWRGVKKLLQNIREVSYEKDYISWNDYVGFGQYNGTGSTT